MPVYVCLIFVAAAWRWADWRRWPRCYPTYLFMLGVSFGAAVLTYEHTLWHFNSSFLLPNHTATDFFTAFTAYPATIALFLSRFPAGPVHKQAGWIAGWAGAYTAAETIGSLQGLVAYDNGWSLGWSAIFNLVMFPLLRLHYLRPGRAWALAAAFAVFVWTYFGFTIAGLK